MNILKSWLSQSLDMVKAGNIRHHASSLKSLCGAVALLICPLSLSAQSVEGTDYYLPKTVLRFTVKVEKTQYTPGKLAEYSFRYLRQKARLTPETSYRIIGFEMTPIAVPDTTKHFNLILEKKRSVNKVTRSDDGLLLAINADAHAPSYPTPKFTPAPKPQPQDPHDFMSGDILNATNEAKMAELSSREIYDIRDSRNQLSRGEADFMPKDGAQLRIMLDNLKRQEEGLMQLFQGTTTKDTAWVNIEYIPFKTGKEILFRFSKHYGVVTVDDLSGEPYYIDVTKKNMIANEPIVVETKKEDKNDIGLRVAQPEMIKVEISEGIKPLYKYDILAPQFGTVESLSGELFGKKQTSVILLNPQTGSIQKIESVNVE